jgi:hypothetical protein
MIGKNLEGGRQGIRVERLRKSMNITTKVTNRAAEI